MNSSRMEKPTSQPSPQAAWAATVASSMSILSLVLAAMAETPLPLVIIMGLCVVCAILVTVGMWKRYFEALVSHKISGNGDA